MHGDPFDFLSHTELLVMFGINNALILKYLGLINLEL